MRSDGVVSVEIRKDMKLLDSKTPEVDTWPSYSSGRTVS
jgi:hypothetical protein